MSQAIFIQSKLPSSLKEFQQIATRWNGYSEVLSGISEGACIRIFTPKRLSPEFLRVLNSTAISSWPAVESKSDFISRVNSLRKQISREKRPTMLVCGDNQLSLLIALFIKFLVKEKPKIQIQFHGDTYTYHSNPGIKGLIRVALSRLGILHADSIRIVSAFQSEELLELSPRLKGKMVLVPIPIDISKVGRHSSIKKYELGFIGRLHPERGVAEFIAIVKSLKVENPKLTLIVVGEGPLLGDIQIELAKWISDGTLIHRGFISSDELAHVYSETRVIVSSAPKEGYGLTIREAVLSGARVVARESRGATEAKEIFRDYIWTYSSIGEAVRLIQLSIEKPEVGGLAKLIEIQTRSDKDGVVRLAKSWLISS